MRRIKFRKWIIILLLLGTVLEGLQKGTPDAVCNFSSSQSMHLTIVTNRPFILNRDALAQEIFLMCQENSFETLKLTRNIEDLDYIEVAVYLWRWQIGKTDPVFKIKYSLDEIHEGEISSTHIPIDYDIILA